MLSGSVKMAWKVLLRRKFYTAVNLFGIAFTLSILILCATLLDSVLAPGAPETRLDRILTIERARLSGDGSSWISNPGYELLDRYARDLPGAELTSITSITGTATSFVDGEKIESTLRHTDGAFWEIMQFDFVEGGPFTRDDVDGGHFVAVINESTRRRFFGTGARSAAGRTLRAGGQTFTVVGVVADVPFTRTLTFADVWVPLTSARSTAYRQGLLGGFQGILLAEDRRAFDGIRQEFQRRLAAAELPDPAHERLEAGAFTRFEEMAHELSGRSDDFTGTTPAVRLMLTAIALAAAFMVLPALNLINLSLSRMLERASEIGVRKAFGASSLTLTGQFLVENVVLTLAGGLAGLALSALAVGAINRASVIPYAQLAVSPRVFLVGLALALLFSVISGTYPAWRMSRLHPVEALRGRV